MRRSFRHRPTPSMAIGLVALFVALSGTAVALPGKNRVDKNDYKSSSIGTRAIANNSVRTQDIRNGNVFSSDVKDGALIGDDVKDDSLTGNDVDEGTLGQVPSAASAGTATSAASAGTAGNAGALDGVDSTGFLRTGNRVRSANNDGVADYGSNLPLVELFNLARGTYSVRPRSSRSTTTAPQRRT